MSWLRHSTPIPQLMAVNNISNSLDDRVKAMVSYCRLWWIGVDHDAFGFFLSKKQACISCIWRAFLVLIFLLIHGHDAKAILRDDGIYLANLRGPQNVVIGLLVSKIYPDKKIGNLFNRAAEKGNLWRKFILLETEADEAVMGWFSQIAVSEFSPLRTDFFLMEQYFHVSRELLSNMHFEQ